MRVDAHHHVWDLAVRDQPWTAALPALRQSFTMADLRPALAAHAIDANLIVQTVCVPAETPELLALAATEITANKLTAVIGWVELTAVEVAEQIAALRACPGGQTLVGIRHQVQLEPDPRWLCRDEVRAGLAELGRCGLAYDLVVTPDQLPGVIETVRALPEVRFVLDHGGKPRILDGVIEPWRSLLAELAQLPNVAVKLSGLVTEAGAGWTVEQLQPYADLLVEAFGPERTMFGSDWPVCLLNASYDEVIDAAEQLSAGLSVTERNAVFGDTAAHWYRITP